MIELPNIIQFLEFFDFLRGNPAAYLVMLTAAMILIDRGKLDLAVRMTRILAPFLLFVALAAVAMGMLNARGRFFIPALAPASFNVCSIVGVVTFPT